MMKYKSHTNTEIVRFMRKQGYRPTKEKRKKLHRQSIYVNGKKYTVTSNRKFFKNKNQRKQRHWQRGHYRKGTWIAGHYRGNKPQGLPRRVVR